MYYCASEENIQKEIQEDSNYIFIRGNICSEDLIYLLHEMGIETGINLNQLINIAKKVENLVGHRLPGQVMRAGPRLLKYSMQDVPTAIGA